MGVKYFLEFNRIYGIFFVSLQIEKKVDGRRMIVGECCY